jgi:nickel/cobalt transporter (NicO) family protein
MIQILTGSIIISLLHAVIPSHWLPILAIGRKEQWSLTETINVTFLSGLAHVLSTVIIGILLGIIGAELSEAIKQFTRVIAPSVLVLLGFYFVRQHYRHHHFHVDNKKVSGRPKSKIIFTLIIAMFLSPCMEIEAYFLLAGAQGRWVMVGIALLYSVITLAGMLLWVRVAYTGLLKAKWHSLEHNAGIITGVTLIITGGISFFIQ